MTAAIQPDGSLPLALRELGDAVAALTGPQSRLIGNRLIGIPSRYMQLQDATQGQQSNTGGGGGSKSRPPFWLDAFDLIREIDETVACWQPAYSGVPPTVGRLKHLYMRNWRPQDVRSITQIVTALAAWTASIDALLDPPPKWTLPSPCPACNTATVYRRDNAGDMVRQPALQLGPAGASCAKCHAVWGPQKFVWLANLLGYDKPAGML